MTRLGPRAIVALALAAPLLLVAPAGSAAAPERTVVVTSGLADNSAREARRTGYQQDFKPTQSVATGWTGGSIADCQPGAPSAAAQQATLGAINYVRELVGVEPVVLDATLSAAAQKAALMMAANHTLDHFPPSSWDCYSAEGAAAAGKSNLFLGSEAAPAIAGYMVDPGSGNYFAGHRRWIIDPRQTRMGSGSVHGSTWDEQSNALYVVDPPSWQAIPAGTPTYLSWPQAGYFPGQLEPGGRWSLSARDDVDFSQATVKVNGSSTGITVNTVEDGYGPNTLVWQLNPSWAPGQADKKYDVVVSGIVGGPASTYSYSVTLFDADVDPHQTITFATPADRTYGAAAATLTPTASSGLPVTLSSSTPSVCTTGGAGGRTVSLAGAGTCTLTAAQSGDALHDPAPSVQRSFSVAKKAITVTADDKVRGATQSQPAFSTSYAGLAYGQTPATSGITGSPDCSTTGTAGQPEGDYPITCTTGTLSSSRYTFTFVPGTLSIDGTAPSPKATGPAWAVRLGASALDWTASDPAGIGGWRTSTTTRAPATAYSTPVLSSWLTSHPVVPSVAPAAGRTTCVSASVRDGVDNGSGVGATQCRHKPLDDKSLTASTGWTTASDSRLWNGSARTTSRLNATLRLGNATGVDRLGVVATRCPGCGSVAVYVGGVRRGTLSLAAGSTVRRSVLLLPRLAAPVSGPVVLKVTTSAKRVQLDGLVVSG